MTILFYLLGILTLMIAYYFKICRQTLFISIYEPVKKDLLFKSLSTTFLLNLVAPFRLGNVYQIFYVGRRLKNGKSFVTAMLIIDIVLDLFSVAIIYACFYGFKLIETLIIIRYASMCGIVVFGLIISILLGRYIKKIILWFCGLFNDNIKLKLLKTSWYTIVSFDNITKKVNKAKLLGFTVCAYLMFLVSFWALSNFFAKINFNLSVVDVFNLTYGDISKPMVWLFYKNSELKQFIYILIYFLVPIALIYLFSFCVRNKSVSLSKKQYLEILPHTKQTDRLVFLEKYFASNELTYFKFYMDLNKDISIIEDNSAGSNATTILCNKDGKTFYRKYAFGDDGKKLYEQIEWIKNHADKLKLTQIEHIIYIEDQTKHQVNVCAYDMPYVNNSVTCFNYVHTTTIDKAWQVLKNVLDDLNSNLHQLNQVKADEKTIEEYIDKKVVENANKIKQGVFIKPVLKYDEIYINGKKYHNLSYYEKYLSKDFLKKIFINDKYADIHGDFTIENIICVKDSDKDDYYIIDPNTGNIHNSPYLDYAKLFQSLHGGYEFLMKTSKISVMENRIDFLSTKSTVYCQLFQKVEKYLFDRFGKEGLRSIYFHEIIHWLRLMPYKIKHNGERSLLFYSGLIMVMADIEEKFKDEISNL